MNETQRSTFQDSGSRLMKRRLSLSLMRFRLLMTQPHRMTCPVKHLKKLMHCRSVKFLEGHCHSIHYAFQLNNCCLDSCAYCSVHPIHMLQNQFESFSYLPMPMDVSVSISSHLLMSMGKFQLKLTDHQ